MREGRLSGVAIATLQVRNVLGRSRAGWRGVALAALVSGAGEGVVCVSLRVRLISSPVSAVDDG